MNKSTYTIVQAATAQEWAAFYALPDRIYLAYPCMFPLPQYEVRRLLDTRKNPFFREHRLVALICCRDGIPVSRMTVHLPLNREKTTVATYGFFESVKDVDACVMLFEYAAGLSREAGMNGLEGPYNPSTRAVSGIQLSGFDNPTVFYEACNPPYYPELMAACGYGTVAHGYTWACGDMRQFRQGSHDIRNEGRYNVWRPRRRDLKKAFADISGIISSAFDTTWRNQPVSPDGDLFASMALLDGWMDGNIAIVYHETEPIGAVVCTLDINPLIKRYEHLPKIFRGIQIRRHLSSVTRLVFYAMAMKEEYRNSPAGYLLAHSFQETAAPFESVNSTWITAGNRASERIAQRFGFKPWKEYGIFGTQISTSTLNTTTFQNQEHGVRHETTL